MKKERKEKKNLKIGMLESYCRANTSNRAYQRNWQGNMESL